MPTIGQLNFALAGFDLDCDLVNFDCDDLLPLVFTREKDALDVAFRSAAIGHVHVSLRLRITQAAIAVKAKQPVGRLSLTFTVDHAMRADRAGPPLGPCSKPFRPNSWRAANYL